jgi:hypothetical protein
MEMFSTGEFWTLAAVVIVILAVGVRWVVLRTTGKDIDPSGGTIVGELRTKIIDALIAGNAIINLEKAQGREAVREAIAARIKAYVEETTMFTDNEKVFIEALDIKWLVDTIEKELIRLGILKAQ